MQGQNNTKGYSVVYIYLKDIVIWMLIQFLRSSTKFRPITGIIAWVLLKKE